ncbi:MAG: molybdopterin-synthase adenylyltransferase MoeB, partial [Myxococcales bacterium]|nr:molybdopterin-synthase adenylyltransferase MoeB [Polyangiaceae bacterium]MDW8250273.1 molybdopterin-synthase adenylyltransferase MoeB [Myxococcales bacterium]
QRLRYERHLRLPEVGEEGQARLLRAKVLLLGAGGLGSPAALYLAAAGVGTLGLVDEDRVELSNLQRQILHTTAQVGRRKVESAEEAIRGLNPEVEVILFPERLTQRNVDRIFESFDLVVDGCDNFPTRYLVNDASLLHKKPVIHGSIFRFEGQATTFLPWRGPCYRCLFPEPPLPHLVPSCAEAGVLGVLPGVIGVIQATEVIKYLLGRGELLVGRLLTYDGLSMRFRELRYERDRRCPGCGGEPKVYGGNVDEIFCSRS